MLGRVHADAVPVAGWVHDDGEGRPPGDAAKCVSCPDLGSDEAPGDRARSIPKDEIVSVDAQEQDLALMLVLDRKQGREPRWRRAGAGKHVDRGVGEELLAHQGRAREGAVPNLQPVDRCAQDTAAIPFEVTETRGPSSVVHVLGERRC